MVEFKHKLSQLEKQLTNLERKNNNLKVRVEELEAANAIRNWIDLVNIQEGQTWYSEMFFFLKKNRTSK